MGFFSDLFGSKYSELLGISRMEFISIKMECEKRNISSDAVHKIVETMSGDIIKVVNHPDLYEDSPTAGLSRMERIFYAIIQIYGDGFGYPRPSGGGDATAISHYLEMFETNYLIGSPQKKIIIRIRNLGLSQFKDRESKSAIKEDVNSLKFKESIVEHMFEAILGTKDFNSEFLINNIYLFEASADRIISSLNNKVDSK